uniref:M56 family metallopeptidase n=1 Tax=Roseihalotalea indica TaxID=2867963 RepID=A0AA49GNM0_9BACT|nr:M56 family metallopeptidase [Tunicatimonas sp. TK19036]
MNSIINYLLEFSICWGVFYLFYVTVLHDQTSYQYNRYYLLASSFLSIIIPLLEIPIGFQSTGAIGESYILLDPMLIGETESRGGAFRWEWYYTLWLAYGLGVLTTFIYYFRQFLSVFWAIRLSKPQPSPQGRYKLVYTNGLFPTSSFFQFLLWDNTQTLTVSEVHQMMAHEETHIKQKHSYDITYITLLKIIFWFHPLVYLYEKAITENHEFAADAGALQHPTGNRQTYSRLLARQSMASLQWAVVNHFYKSKTLKRIKMMEKRHKTFWYRYVLIAPIVASMFVVFACQPDTEELEQEAIAQSYEEVQTQLKQIGGQLQQLNEKYFENPGSLREAINAEAQKSGVAPQPPHLDDLQLKVFKDKASGGDYDKFESLLARQKQLQEKLMSLPDAAGVYTVVEEQPAPEGGMETFYQYIAKNLQYPLKARQMGIEGRVFVQFVVNENGELTDFQALKGIGAGCDAEAIRVLEGASGWQPGMSEGKPVKVRMVLPITFKLDGNDSAKTEKAMSMADPETISEKLSEIVVVAYI